ncbi:MAG: hypothetical protein JST28_24140 [Acidobacteria bacterium]|nr:hypothetical protein [Acidobacteriota bacterium]
MSPFTENRFDRSAGALAAEETLRMIATLPAPAGLEDRVKAGLQSAPKGGRVLAWPFVSMDGWMRGAGMRAAAAAAIVLAVAGGGWGVYSHIQIAPVPSALVEPLVPNAAGRFSSAGAMRVPQTVQGPVDVNPVMEKRKLDAVPQTSQGKAMKKGKARTDSTQR